MQSSEVKFNSVALFAIQHAELWSEALRQCWATRQWDIVPRPSWSYGDVTPRILQDQHPAIPLQILVNPFITSWNPRRNNFKTCLHEMVNKCSLHVHVQSRSSHQSKPLKTGAGGPADKIVAPRGRSELVKLAYRHCPPPETIVTGVSVFEWGGFNSHQAWAVTSQYTGFHYLPIAHSRLPLLPAWIRNCPCVQD